MGAARVVPHQSGGRHGFGQSLPRQIAWLLVGVLLVLVAAEAVQPGARSQPRGATNTVGDGQTTVVPLAAQGPISAALGRAEAGYRVTGLRARNPAQHLAIGFSPAGVSVASGAARVRLRLTQFGSANGLRPVNATRPDATAANRVVYSPGDGVREWYANGPLGLEQGFDVARRPAGSGSLRLELSVSGDARAQLGDGGVVFSAPGSSLRYAGLIATDARGRRLPAALSLHGGRLVISVDDGNARYPVRIDPFVQAANLNEPPGSAMDAFGYSTAVAGGTIAVGAPGHTVGANASQGAVFVFTKPATGWATTTNGTMLTASDGAGGDQLGFTVATNGTTVVSGAPGHAVGGNAVQGAAYVWVEHGGTWPSTQTAELTAPDGAASDGGYFPVTISPDGDTVAFGVPSHMVGTNVEQGEAYAFTQPPAGWGSATPQVAELTARDGGANDLFGLEVAASNDTLAVQGGLGGGGSRNGAIYIYTKSGAAWSSGTQQAELTATGAPTLGVGSGSLAISSDGSTIAAGAPTATVGANSGQGEVFVFDRPGSTWMDTASQNATLTASTGAAGDNLGFSVGISGTEIVAGAPGRTAGGVASAGAAFVFEMPPGGWHGTVSQAEELTPPTTTGTGLGYSLGFNGTTIAAGTRGHQLGDFVFTQQYKVFGTVSGTQCTVTSCTPPSGVGGFTVLVKGTALDGTAVSVTDLSDASGSWSVNVPPGSYVAGLSPDGSSFAGTAMEQPVNVTNADVPGVDFTSCAEPASSSAARAVRGMAADDPLASIAEASFTPSYCESEYTVKLTAKIPQPILVDPSRNAHYNTTDNNGPKGFNHTPTFLQSLRQTFRSAAGFNEEFPECMRPGQVAAFTKEKAKAEWYDYIKAGTVIGSATLKYIWNQSAKTVQLAAAPTTTMGSLTRVFVWRVKLPSGKEVSGQCQAKAQVPMLLVAQPTAGGAEGASGGEARHAEPAEDGSARSFTVTAAWWLPFDEYGAQIDRDTSLAEKAVDGGLELVKGLFKGGGELLEKYEKLPAWQRFLIELPVGLVIGAAEEKAYVNGATAAASFYKQYSTGTALTAEELEHLELIGSVKGWLEHYIDVPLEAMGVVTGYLGYPVMSAVIRGQFTTTKYLPSAQASPPKLMPYQQTLAVTAQTTRFPSISLQISRDALDTCLSGCKVWEGALPWASSPTSEPETFNPFADNPPYFVEDSTKHGDQYKSGIAAVKHVIADTKQNPELASSVRKKGNLTSGYGAAVAQTPAPECDADTGRSNSPETICWIFNDWRP